MWLKFIDVDESWPYHVFKKVIRNKRKVTFIQTLAV